MLERRNVFFFEREGWEDDFKIRLVENRVVRRVEEVFVWWFLLLFEVGGEVSC